MIVIKAKYKFEREEFSVFILVDNEFLQESPLQWTS